MSVVTIHRAIAAPWDLLGHAHLFSSLWLTQEDNVHHHSHVAAFQKFLWLHHSAYSLASLTFTLMAPMKGSCVSFYGSLDQSLSPWINVYLCTPIHLLSDALVDPRSCQLWTMELSTFSFNFLDITFQIPWVNMSVWLSMWLCVP